MYSTSKHDVSFNQPQNHKDILCLSVEVHNIVIKWGLWLKSQIFCFNGSETWTIKARDARRITAAGMKYMRRTTGYAWIDYKTNAQIAKELKITPFLDKLLEYMRKWIQHVNRMPRNRVTKHYSPTGRRNHGRSLKRFLGTWDRNESTSGPTPWQIYDDDDDDDDLLLQLTHRT